MGKSGMIIYEIEQEMQWVFVDIIFRKKERLFIHHTELAFREIQFFILSINFSY